MGSGLSGFLMAQRIECGFFWSETSDKNISQEFCVRGENDNADGRGFTRLTHSLFKVTEKANWNCYGCGLITLNWTDDDTTKSNLSTKRFIELPSPASYSTTITNCFCNLSSTLQLNEQFSNKKFPTSGVKGKWNLNKIMSFQWKSKRGEKSKKLIDGICLHRWKTLQWSAMENNFHACRFNKLINFIHNISLLCSRFFNWFENTIQRY